MLFALTVIVGVAAATAGAVAMFVVDPSQGVPEEKQAVGTDVAADAAAVAAMSASNLPVHKVTTQMVKPAAVKAAATAEDASADDKQPKIKTATAETATVDDAELQQQDPRWARSDSEKAATMFASVLQPSASSGQAQAAATGALALAEETPSKLADKADDTETAAIAPEDLQPKKAAKAKPEQPKQAAVEEEQDSPPGVSSSTRNAQVIRGANMRSRPKSGSSVLGVVPKGASVQLVGCNVWCEIVYKGKRGYVYKSFIAGAGGKVSDAKAPKSKTTFTVSSEQPAEQPAEQKTDKAADAKPTFKVISSRLQ